jgi:hypothetical protein
MPPVPGFYEPFRRAVNRLVGLGATEQNPATSVFAGAASGVVGGCFFDTLDRTPKLITSLSYSWKSPVLD